MSENNKISLDSLMRGSATMSQDQSQALVAQVEKKVAVMSPEDRARVDEIKEGINLQDSQVLAIYGTQSQKGVAQFSGQILSEVRSKNTGDAGVLMRDLMVKVKDMDFSTGDKSFLSRLPLVGRAKQSFDRILARYQVMENQIDKIQAQLESARMELLKDIGVFDKLYEKNMEYFHDLEYYIVAGEEKVKEAREEVLPSLYQEAQEAEDPMALQVVRDFEDNVNRFEKRIFDLKTSKTVAIQTAPQIKLIQNNDQLLVDKIGDAIHNTVPLWKSQVVIALGLNKQGQVLEMQKAVSDATNELLRKNARNLKQSTLKVAEEAERSTIDVDTLKEVNQELISTIEESIKIHDQARENRKRAEVELVKIESDLHNALDKTLNRGGRLSLE